MTTTNSNGDMCRCGRNPATEELHSCPFQSDVNGDPSEDYCDCCHECEHQCAQDI